MTSAYLDSSFLLGLVLEEREQSDELNHFDTLYSSRLIEIECHRTLHRLLLTGAVEDKLYAELRQRLYFSLQPVTIVELSPVILSKASGSFSTVLGTLDALHLSTALALLDGDYEPTLAFLTHDSQLARGARSEGMQVIGD